MATVKKKSTITKPKPPAKSTTAVKPKSSSAKLTLPTAALSSSDPADLSSDPSDSGDLGEAWDPSKARLFLSRLQPRWSTLSPTEIAELDSLSTDPQRSALGGRTKARAVAADAVRWAASLDRQLREFAILREHYDPSRFAYYLLRLDALVQAVGEEGSRAASKGVARSGAGTAIELARAARDNLIRALDRFAGRREAKLEQISRARNKSPGDDGIVESLKNLVALAEGWLKTESAFLLKTAHLTPALVAEARAAADRLASAGASATEAGPLPARDSPAVNLVEGWMLEEMLRARDDVEAARRDSPVIERLVPSSGTRAVLGVHSKKEASAAPEVTAASSASPG